MILKMTIQDLKKWQTLHELDDGWWVQIGGETLGRKVNLEKIEQILDRQFDSEVMVLQVSQASQRPRPWIAVERVKDAHQWVEVEMGKAVPVEKPHDNVLDGKKTNDAFSGERESRLTQNVNFHSSQAPPVQAPVSDARLPSALPRKQQIKAKEEAQTYEAEEANTIGSVIMRLFSFRGRIGRSQFILWYSIKLSFLMILSIVILANKGSIVATEITLVILVPFFILIAWLNLSLICRRLKDCDNSPYILILLLIPIVRGLVSIVVMLVCIFQPTSRKCPKKYGEKYDIL
jgi:uncharacterized membrane protein YhaH (DUF805 family)